MILAASLNTRHESAKREVNSAVLGAYNSMSLNGRESIVTLHKNQRQLSGNACVSSWPLPDIRQFQKANLNTGRSDL